jgi:hypothetical protein
MRIKERDDVRVLRITRGSCFSIALGLYSTLLVANAVPVVTCLLAYGGFHLPRTYLPLDDIGTRLDLTEVLACDGELTLVNCKTEASKSERALSHPPRTKSCFISLCVMMGEGDSDQVM